MKITYGLKEIFLLFSWILLFKSNSVNDSGIFLTSIMIYSGAIIFDLIFFAIEARSKASNWLKGAYYGSIVLAIANGFIALVGLLGAFEMIAIEPTENTYQMIVTKGDLTAVYNVLLPMKVKLWIYMTLVLIFGLFEIFPGWFLIKDKSQKQIESSD
ncbi:MAG: hypothetical protein NC347_05845 [Clostridium sp.]|nr:hypothetical protein [Clostridium sp.]